MVFGATIVIFNFASALAVKRARQSLGVTFKRLDNPEWVATWVTATKGRSRRERLAAFQSPALIGSR